MKYTTHNMYNDFYEALEQRINESKVAYRGPIENNIFLAIDQYSKAINNTYPDASRKLYKIFIELTQNIVYYSSEVFISPNDAKIGRGAIYIYETADHIKMVTANPVQQQEIEPLLEKCAFINSLTTTLGIALSIKGLSISPLQARKKLLHK